MIAKLSIALALVFSVARVAAADQLKVPNLIGKTVEQANQIATDAGFPKGVSEQRAGDDCKGDVKDKGIVKCQSPAPGTMMYRYDVIIVFTIQPPPRKYIEYDDVQVLVGMPLEDAKKHLAALGYHGKLTTVGVDLEGCKPGTVCEVKPNKFYDDDPVELDYRIVKKLDIAPP